MKVLLLLYTVSLLVLLRQVHSKQHILNDISTNNQQLRQTHVEPLDPEIFSNLYTYAHLIDISYCISNLGGIEKPFKCDLNCESRFPNMTLIYQWYFDDSVAGYIATTHDNIFRYNETTGGNKSKKKKTIIISLRGTKSFSDTYADLKINMINYSNLGLNLKLCGSECKVHKGFYEFYTRTLNVINQYVINELKGLEQDVCKSPREEEDYELIILGHSLGGSVALLLGLHYLDMGYDKLTLVTMGQPLLGNYEFVNWVDEAMSSSEPPKHNDFKRKFLRVIHKNDIITTLPKNQYSIDKYYQFNNQIYLNCSASNTRPSLDQVVDCIDGDNDLCIAKDYPYDILDRHNYLQIHLTYFRRIGFCGIRI
ncbi:hypothetical protein KGF54_000373 [Candida jiufengensis]|uniref:uncharacterized protein n=1 Tax=Candida jiufengensis TaxID=497108 RepID=UPI0022252015|nr:uncharacterized protein KGF54_000373 [Candida jiufengensis]KAI5956756.1 hypothetical protein KGF54_000373 [Candida jiufengensis]